MRCKEVKVLRARVGYISYDRLINYLKTSHFLSHVVS